MFVVDFIVEVLWEAVSRVLWDGVWGGIKRLHRSLKPASNDGVKPADDPASGAGHAGSPIRSVREGAPG